MKYFLIVFCFFLNFQAQSQEIKLLSEGGKVSLRGLSVVSDDVFWASGSSGTVARSIDGGKHIKWMKVSGYEKRDFRDIEAFDSTTAIIIAVAEPGLILKTTDGGASWKKVFEDTTSGVFLDAIDFHGNDGIVIGDPIGSKAYILTTNDKGETWVKSNEKKYQIHLRDGEAFFAASGSNVLMNPTATNDFIFVTGGLYTALYHHKGKLELPLQSGHTTTGANGIALDPTGKYLAIVGGDFSQDKRTDSTIALLNVSKKYKPFNESSRLNGYRSGITWMTDKTVVACGTSGVDFSSNQGKSWSLISNIGLHVVKKSPTSKLVYLAGPNGRIAKIFY